LRLRGEGPGGSKPNNGGDGKVTISPCDYFHIIKARTPYRISHGLGILVNKIKYAINNTYKGNGDTISLWVYYV